MSFANGMRMGMDAWDSAQEAKLREKEAERRKVLDDRATVEWEQRQADGARDRSNQARIDGLKDQLTRPNAGNYSLASASAPVMPGMRAPAQGPEVTDEGLDAATAAPIGLGSARAAGLSMDAPSAPGLASAKLTAPPGGYTAKEVPTRGAAEDILAQIALAKDDQSAFRAAMTAKRNYDFQDGITQHTKAFQSMAPEAKTALMEKFTSDQGIPLNMVPSSGKDKYGNPTFTTWVEGKPRVQLGNDEMSQLYAASNLMGTHPDLAKAYLEKGSDNLRKLFKDFVEVNDKMMDTNNQATSQGGLIDAKSAAQKTAEYVADARARAAAVGKVPAGYRQSANGNLEAIPGGPADLKLQGAFNGDTAALTGSLAGFDRLAAAANEVLVHPGLDSITGIRGVIPNVPGGKAANAEALLATLKSQVGFGVLQDMRNNSKTGGALGSVSDAEGKRLEANLAALDKAQSAEQYRAQLTKIVEYAEQAKDRMRDSFNMRHPADGKSRPEAAAGTAAKAQTPTAAPKAGERVRSSDGATYIFKGGDVKDKKNWELSK